MGTRLITEPAMQFAVTVRYSEALIRLAARRFLVRFARRDMIFATALAAFAIALLLVFDMDWKTPTGMLVLAVLLALLILHVGMRSVQMSLSKFRSLKDPTAYWTFSDDFVGAKTELGCVEYRWQVITEVWRYPEFWLLLFGNTGYSVLPIAELTEEVQAFILARIQAHGGKIS